MCHIFGVRLVTLILDWFPRWELKIPSIYTAWFIYWDYFTFTVFKKWCFYLCKKLHVLKSIVFTYVTTGFLVSHIPSIVEQNGRQWNSSYMLLTCTEKVAAIREPLSDSQWWDVLSPAPATALIMMPHPVTSQTSFPTAIQGSLLLGSAPGTFCSKRQ